MYIKKLEVKDFGGIDHNSPIVLEMDGKSVVKINGDNGAGKSSLLNALLVGTGRLSKDNAAFVNNETGKLDIDLSFIGNDKKEYSVRATKSQFKLTYNGENLDEPVTKLKELIGVVGVSPMEIKYKPLKDQIKWIASYSNIDEAAFEKKIDKIKLGIKESRAARAAANKTYKALKEVLEDNSMYNSWEKSEEKFKSKVDVSKLSEQLKLAGDASDKYIQAEVKVKNLKERQLTIREQIETLQNELDEVDKSIVKGDKYLADNKEAKKNYDNVRIQYDGAAAAAVEYDRWQDVKRKKNEMDEYETISQRSDAMEKKLLQDQKELQWEILPDIKGVEFVLEDTHEDGQIVKEGIYWNGKTTAQMSETEFWDIVLQIWLKFKVSLIVIDNYQALGSMAVKTLEKLYKSGASIFASQMQRGQKELTVDISKNLD